MTAKQLRNKHKRERKNKRINMVKSIVGTVVLIAIMIAGIGLFLRTWEQEMDIQAQKNIEWQTKYSR